MIVNVELLGIIITAFAGIIVALIGASHRRDSKEQESRAEAQKQIGKIRNELDDLKAGKDDAHDALTRQMALCMHSGNDKAKLLPLIMAANEMTERYQKKKADLYAQMDKWWESPPKRKGFWERTLGKSK